MLRVMTQAEIDANIKRKTLLFQSEYLVDNFTAVLMDTTLGESGLFEPCARSKAHRLLDWICYRLENDALNERAMPDCPWSTSHGGTNEKT
jgi:hypothetical protein